jgi:histidine decarboxylase
LKNPILYTSKDSHLSIFKASKFFRIDMEEIDTLKSGEINYEAFEQLLKKNKDRDAVINLNIGTTVKGSIDNVDKILNILKKNGFKKERFHIHCDCELFSMLLPEIDTNIPKITFEKEIGSVSVIFIKLTKLFR